MVVWPISFILCTEGGNSLCCTDNVWTNISCSGLKKKKNGTRAHPKENNLRLLLNCDLKIIQTVGRVKKLKVFQMH